METSLIPPVFVQVQTASPSDFHAGELLNAMRSSIPSNDDRVEGPNAGPASATGNLKIINPDVMPGGAPQVGDPSTPWDSEVEKLLDTEPLEDFSAFPASRIAMKSCLNDASGECSPC